MMKMLFKFNANVEKIPEQNNRARNVRSRLKIHTGKNNGIYTSFIYEFL